MNTMFIVFISHELSCFQRVKDDFDRIREFSKILIDQLIKLTRKTFEKQWQEQLKLWKTAANKSSIAPCVFFPRKGLKEQLTKILLVKRGLLQGSYTTTLTAKKPC